MKRLAFGLVGLVLLSACGVTGQLKRPPPMWNAASAEAADARRQQAECQRRHKVCPASPSTSSASPADTSPNAPPGSATTPPATPQ